LRPVTSYKDVLPEDDINKAHRVMSKHMFDQAAFRKALWLAQWSLFFAEDNYVVYYYKSKWFPQQQEDLVIRWERLRIWWSGSTRNEVKNDFLAFIVAVIVHVLLVPAYLEIVGWIRRDYTVLIFPTN
jgi:hypothetical protein